MNTIYAALIIVAAALIGASCVIMGDPKDPPATVPHVDLARYQGTWYEIARYPNRFQKGCRHTTATYTIRDDGAVRVVNRCVRGQGEGTVDMVDGVAKVVDAETNAKLKVTFFWPFYGPYWIIDLDPGYGWAVVGHPKRKLLWVLARTPALDDATYQRVLSGITSAGYDPSQLLITDQKK